MNNKVVGIIIVAMVSVILIGGLLAPIVSDATASSDTFVNDGYYDMSLYGADDDITLTWSFENPRQVIINGEAINIPEINDPIGETSIVIAPSAVVRVAHTSTSLTFYGNGSYVTGNAANPNFTLTYVGGTLTATNGTATKEITGIADLVCIAKNGELTMKKYGESVFTTDDSYIYAGGLTYFGAQVLQYSIWGTFDNLTNNPVSENYTVTDFTKNYTVDEKHIGLYVLDDFTFNASYSGGEPKGVTYSTFAVSKVVTADRTDPMDSAPAGILAAVPIIVIVSILATIAGIMIRSRF